MIKKCNECKEDKIIPAKENKREFIIKNNSKKNINKVKVDDCLIKSGQKCDYLFEIECESLKEIFYVELKGKDLNHALEQILTTIKFCETNYSHHSYKRKAFVVLSRYPKEDSSIQKRKKEFKRQNITLKSATNKHEEVI